MYLSKRAKWHDQIPGGLADKKTPKDFDQKSLQRGIKVELEHTDDRKLAEEIAMDHLTEDQDYYEKLEKMEKGASGGAPGDTLSAEDLTKIYELEYKLSMLKRRNFISTRAEKQFYRMQESLDHLLKKGFGTLVHTYASWLEDHHEYEEGLEGFINDVVNDYMRDPAFKGMSREKIYNMVKRENADFFAVPSHIQAIFDQIVGGPTGNTDKDIANFNMALNATHTSGGMAEYIPAPKSGAAITPQLLSSLSAGTLLPQWDEEIKRISMLKMSKDPLSKYHKKRDFSKTKEPEGETKEGKNEHRFVIQDHYASHHHWDLRLENDKGTMSSWALPKHHMPTGKERMLAQQTEDHPISYNKFVGKIPEGEYGAGTVKKHDIGTYTPIEWTSSTIKFKLNGKKEHGTYTLHKTHGKSWMLMVGKEKE